jgi:penicillin-binding protein 2
VHVPNRIIRSNPTELEKFLDHVAERESNNTPTVINRYGMLGKYQFSPLTIKGLGYTITKEEFLKKMKKACQAPNSPRKESVFEKQMSAQTYATLQEKLYRFKGFFVQKRTVRRYPKPIAAHLLGYVGEIGKEQAEKEVYYKEGDYIGISGLERSYEEVLRGKKGTQIAITDVHNKIIGRYMDGKYDTLAIPGQPLYCSIDMDLQEYGERLMQGKKGAVVAIEPSTGEVVCLISGPNYDPNLLVGGQERSKNFTKL